MISSSKTGGPESSAVVVTVATGLDITTIANAASSRAIAAALTRAALPPTYLL